MPARTTATTARRTALLSLSSALALGLSIGLVGCSSTDESGESSGAGAESAQSPAPTTVTQAPTPGSGDVLITVEHGADAEAKIITHDSGQPLQQILEGAGSWEAILPADQLPPQVTVVVSPRDGAESALSCRITRDGKDLAAQSRDHGTVTCEAPLT